MRPRDRVRAQQIDDGLETFARTVRVLPGIADQQRHHVFVEQLLESIHRVDFVQILHRRHLSDRRGDPGDELFDPLKAAIVQQRRGNPEEAFWLIFLFVHFGKHPRGGWRYAREVYGRLGQTPNWNWVAVSQDPLGFRTWLRAQQAHLKRPGAGFGNHRKFESLDAYSDTGTGAIVESYVRWVKAHDSHERLIADVMSRNNQDGSTAFEDLFCSMREVVRFGRLARFDYLAMLGKLGLAPIKPGSPHLEGASGPLNGARILFGSRESASTLNTSVIELDGHLHVGMQVLEDALCNWQKSPHEFHGFRA